MTVEKMTFKTEVNQLLNLMIHSLYSHKEVSIRELISNASDAIDKARYESLTNEDILEQKGDWKIRIVADSGAGTLTISDNGIGMSKEETIEALGTIAHSGTREFLRALQQKQVAANPELIGQFGVGFYASFMISDKVTLLSRKAGSGADSGVRWESTADGTFTVDDIVKDTPGTDVILHLKEEERKYLEEWQIREIVRKYSDYIEHPIFLEVGREETSALDKNQKITVRKDEQINAGKAIWLRERSEIADNEYNEFYKHLSHDMADPLKIIHYRAEGTTEFTCLLYIPAHAPFDIFQKEYKIGPALYVRKVQIMDHCEELVPPYLRFLSGIVDSSDLPLNVSREILQNNRQVAVIKNNITKKVLDTIAEMKKSDAEKYREFHAAFGKVLKEGIHYDHARKEAIADLLLFHSTATDGSSMRSLADYCSALNESQNEIYYMTGPSLPDMMQSPYLELFREKGIEVLFLTDEIDDLIFGMFEYRGKRFKSVLKGDISIEKSKDREESGDKFGKLIDYMKDILRDDVKDVRISGRLKDSPCCLVSEEGDLDPRMQKLLQAMGQDIPSQKKILEINPGHPLFESMRQIFDRDAAAPVLQEYTSLLFDQALLLAGTKPKDPVLFAQYVSRLMIEGASRLQLPQQADNT